MSSGLDEPVLSEIALQSRVNVAIVRSHYYALLSELKSQARIHDYIPLLAMKLVRQQFRPKPAAPQPAIPTERQRIKRLAREFDFIQINYGH